MIMTSRKKMLTAALLGLAVLFANAGIRADIIPHGRKVIDNESRIDLGPFARYAPRPYKIRKGDTLAKVAENHLGDAKRVHEILALNPTLAGKELTAGTEILLPSPHMVHACRSSGDSRKAGKPPLYYFFLYGKSFFKDRYYWGPKVLVHKGKLGYLKFGGRVFAVPHDKVKDFLAWYGRKPRPKQAKWLISTDIPRPTLIVDSTSRTSKVISWYSVHGIKDGKIVISLKEQQFDGTGRKIAGFMNPLMLSLAAIGLVGLVIQILRRRQAALDHA